EALQHSVPPADGSWKIGPGQLTRPGRLAFGASASVALVRRLDWDRPGPTHHLLLLPQAQQLMPNKTTTVTTPTMIVIGEAAVDVTPSDTLVPAVTPADAEDSVAFQLNNVEQALHPLDRLDGFPINEELGRLRMPESEVNQALRELSDGVL